MLRRYMLDVKPAKRQRCDVVIICVCKLLDHPLTDIGAEKFRKDLEKVTK